jgi:DNA-binding FrmR family transcriptional regulator
MRLFKTILFLLIISISTIPAFSQGKKSLKKTYNKGVDFFNKENYKAALTYFEQLDSIDFENKLEVKYYIGACHLNIPQNKEKALPFLEYVINTKEGIVPANIFKDLGIIYLHKHNFDKSAELFKKYQATALFENTSISDISPKEYFEWIKNAKKFVKDSTDTKVEQFSKKSNYSEFSPYITADESELFFMRNAISKDTKWDSVPQIMYCAKINGIWNNPAALSIENAENKQIKLAGVSPDGQSIYLFFDSKLHTCLVETNNQKCVNLKEVTHFANLIVPEHISVSADGNSIYFSAVTSDGVGGKDIFSIKKNSNGKWSKPTNLGNKLNSKFDEIMPFIHPDNKTLYFVSKGHNTMGGFDIFKSVMQSSGKWSKPINLGYPINSTYDDLNFTLSAQSNTAYFSKKINAFSNQLNIYKAAFNKSVPLTLVKGVILGGNPLMPIGAKIQVVDKETNTKVKYIYNPSPLTGKFLMIFPPGKNYDMIINADNYLPQLINIYIPNQTYFYELFQEIHLTPVSTLGKIVGEEISVKNKFYDVNSLTKSGKIDSLQVNENKNLQNIVNQIISITDSLNNTDINYISNYLANNPKETEKPKKNYLGLLELINKAIENTDTSTLNKLNIETIYEQKANQNYFYSENNKYNLIPYIVDKDTLYTAPSVNTQQLENTNVVTLNEIQVLKSDIKNEEKNDSILIRKIDVSKQKIIISYPISFVDNQTNFNKKHLIDIFELSQLVLNNKRLAIEIEGFTTKKDSSSKECITLNNRIKSITNALNENDIFSSKYVINKVTSTQPSSEINVKIFEIISTDTISQIITKEDIANQKAGKKIEIKNTIKKEELPIKKEEKQPTSDIIYRVQIKATKQQLNTNHLTFKGLSVTRYFHDGLYKYVTGNFTNEQDAEKFKNEMIKIGFEDAFIVKFDKENRIN